MTLRLCAARISAAQDPSALHGERARWERMPPRRAREFVAGRALARRAAGSSAHRWAGLSAAGPGAKPVAVSGGYDLSIAHDGGFAVVATVASGAVGVDVVGSGRILPRAIERRLCTPGERAALPAGAAAHEALLELLLVKEAYAKARGVGLALGFTGISAREIGTMPGVRVRHTGGRHVRICTVHIEAGA